MAKEVTSRFLYLETWFEISWIFQSAIIALIHQQGIVSFCIPWPQLILVYLFKVYLPAILIVTYQHDNLVQFLHLWRAGQWICWHVLSVIIRYVGWCMCSLFRAFIIRGRNVLARVVRCWSWWHSRRVRNRINQRILRKFKILGRKHAFFWSNRRAIFCFSASTNIKKKVTLRPEISILILKSIINLFFNKRTNIIAANKKEI